MSFLDLAVRETERALRVWLPSGRVAPQRLHAAMRHSVLGGGKRLRPALVLAACRAAGGADRHARPAMVAVELLHTYTLIHDDLPAMDDDDLRRGRPTCHKAFDEYTAILAGDALQALAFRAASEIGADAVACLAEAAGSTGVVGGQQDDMDHEGRRRPRDAAAVLERIHRRKTAALIRASCELGALAAGATVPARRALARAGELAGLAFQIRDDVLDCTASTAALGKSAGKDRDAAKLTWPALHGLAASQAEVERLSARAAALLKPFGHRAGDLAGLIHAMATRAS